MSSASQDEWSSMVLATTWMISPVFCTRPLMSMRRAPITTARWVSSTCGQITALQTENSSSSVRKTTPLAEPGRWRTSTTPATVTGAPLRSVLSF